MIYSFEARCVVQLEFFNGEKTSEVRETDFNLEVSSNLDRSIYLDKEDLPTAEGSKAITTVFITGLIANIKLAHKNGWVEESQHMRYIIDHLQRGFVTNIKEIKKGDFK